MGCYALNRIMAEKQSMPISQGNLDVIMICLNLPNDNITDGQQNVVIDAIHSCFACDLRRGKYLR